MMAAAALRGFSSRAFLAYETTFGPFVMMKASPLSRHSWLMHSLVIRQASLESPFSRSSSRGTSPRS
jgi:hypothetical protein